MTSITPSGYLIPVSVSRVEETLRRSRFIATVGHAGSVEEARGFIAGIAKEFPDATHHCRAYQTGPPGDTAFIGMSDDGEPAGTAGRPMLNVLLHSGVGEIVAVTARWFGGVKLGTGGLSRAYSGVVKRAVDALEVGEKIIPARLRFSVDYEHVPRVKRVFEIFNANVEKEDYGKDAAFCVSVAEAAVREFEGALLNAARGKVRTFA